MNNNIVSLLTALVCAILVHPIGVSSDFQKEKPSVLKTCERKSDDFTQCLIDAFQHFFTDWKNGIPGVADAKSIDPLYVPKFDVIEDSGNITPITVKVQNITVTGLSDAIIKNISMKNNEYSFKMTYSVPKVRIDGQYSAIGQILLLKLDSNGKLFMEILRGLYTITAKIKLLSHEDWIFFDMKSLQFTLNSIEQMEFFFSDLFKDKTINDNANALFNESWRTFYEIFKPKIEQEIGNVLFEHFRHVFKQVPAHFFIADVGKGD